MTEHFSGPLTGYLGMWASPLHVIARVITLFGPSGPSSFWNRKKPSF